MRRVVFHRILLMCIVLLAAAGCLDGSYSGPFDPTTLAVDPIAIVIRFADKEESKASYDGRGPVQDLTKLENDTMYVSIVRKGSSFADASNFLLRNRPAVVNLQDSKLDWMLKDGDAPVYYPWRERANEGYEMFAWYSDSAVKGATEFQKDRVCKHLRIDGTQDIMGSKAYAYSTETPDEKLHTFSYYTAVRNMEPRVCPEHLLTCLSFKFRSSVSEFKQDMTIKSVTLKACDNIVLTACCDDDRWREIETEGEKVDFGSNLIPDYEKREGKQFVVNSVARKEDIKAPQYLGDIMFPPTTDAKTNITVTGEQLVYKSDGTIYGPVPFHANLDIDHPSGLKAGSNYVVCLTVSGTDLVSSQVSVVEWGEGGSIIVDSDVEPGFN